VKLLVSGKHRPAYDLYDVGHLLCPRSRNVVWSRAWAADNAAFSRFDAEAYVSMLARVRGLPGCLFVTAPDVVGDAFATRELWRDWYPALSAYGLPLAFVLQDGVEDVGVPWLECGAVFVGGSTAFKLGPTARMCVQEAKRQGKWVHMGRVNTAARLRYAQHIGCDSVDGSGFARFPDAMFPRFSRVASQPPLLTMDGAA
jgi:hypothetical protein